MDKNTFWYYTTPLNAKEKNDSKPIKPFFTDEELLKQELKVRNFDIAREDVRSRFKR